LSYYISYQNKLIFKIPVSLVHLTLLFTIVKKGQILWHTRYDLFVEYRRFDLVAENDDRSRPTFQLRGKKCFSSLVASNSHNYEPTVQTHNFTTSLTVNHQYLSSSIFHAVFNAVLIRLVDQVKISLLLKIQWQEHDYLSEHRCGSVQELKSRDPDDAESGSTRRAKGQGCRIE
jgi:hypothetical protein